MSKQREQFVGGEADAWFERNRSVLEAFDPECDPVARLVGKYLRPKMVVAEVGCSTANRVAYLANLAQGRGLGVDPSGKAVLIGRLNHPWLELLSATAESLPWADNSIDVLVYGFCLYVCDRNDLFRIAAEGDRVLKPSGMIVVLDFLPPFAYCNGYTHRAGLHSYKMDYTRLWTWNPSYVEIGRRMYDHGAAASEADSTFAPDERTAVVLLKKLPEFSYAKRPDYPHD